MLKLLITGLLVYALYRYFFGANSLGSGPQDGEGRIRYRDKKNAPPQEEDDGDYIDYEEVD
jgi:hypothetical protein